MIELQHMIVLLKCRKLDGHIHRVVVVDDHRRPIGVVTTTDILAAYFADTDG